MKNDFDSPWKEAIGKYFEQFLEFFFPHIWSDIDWARGYQMLDTELRKIVRDASVGCRRVDVLVRVTRLSGAEQWVMIHIEVQSQVDPDFGCRMAVYRARVRDRYNCDVCSLAILGDENPRWRPRSYSSEMWGCRQTFKFLMRKLLDYPKTARTPNNPFSWIVASHRQAQATQQDPLARKVVKFRLMRGLICGSGLGREQVQELLRLVDWILALPKEIEYDLRDELAQLDKERTMVYVTSFERIGLEKGMAQGMAQGLAQGMARSVTQVLKARWGLVDSELSQRLEAIADAEKLSTLLDAALQADSLE